MAEISGNRKAQKADLKKAQLDSAYAWGTAIGEQEEDYSNQFLPDSFCSGCGVKLSLSSNFCSGCGKKTNEIEFNSSIPNQRLYSKNKKSKSSVWIVLLLLLALTGVGYGVYENILPNGSPGSNPEDYGVNSVIDGDAGDSGSWERVCQTIRTQEEWEPGELTDAVLNGGGGPRSSTTEVCEDVWVP